MSKEEWLEFANKVYLCSYLKCILISNDSKDITKAYFEDEQEEMLLLNGIEFILDNEAEYVFLDEVIIDNIYTILGEAKQLQRDNKKEIIEKVNSIIIKVNRLKSENFNLRQEMFFQNQSLMRYNREYSPVQADKETFKELLFQLLCSDYKLIDAFGDSNDNPVQDNMLMILASINYLLYQYPQLYENEVILYKTLSINTIITEYINKLKELKILDKSAYKLYKLMEKKLRPKVILFAEEMGISNKKVKEVEKKTKDAIEFTLVKTKNHN